MGGRILITNHWLKKAGGSETFTYTLAGELVRRGYLVDLFTLVPGMVSQRIKKDYGVRVHTTPGTLPSVDGVLANHKTTVGALSGAGLGPIIQTCHGTTPRLEQPQPGAASYVAISKEVARHVKKQGYKVAAVINNGVDLERFNPTKPLNKKPKFALSLAHSDAGNQVLRQACNQAGIKLLVHNKFKNPRWDIETVMNQVDIVFTLGRGAYEALGCGRCVMVFDKRPYQAGLGDGMITPDNISRLVVNNCSGRTKRIKLTTAAILNELEHYQADTRVNRSIALEYFDIKKAAAKYLTLL